jgi:2-oxoglutarate ferredoxin oxidoreductase subunit gamma
MRNEVMFAGFGGQGVVKSALLLAEAAGLHEGKEVAQTQSYGPEARGGACRSEVVISDEEIDYVRSLDVDFFVVMSQPALDQYVGIIDPDRTTVIIDTTLICDVPERLNNVYLLDATRISEREFGRRLFANMIMLGALCGIAQLVSVEAIENCMGRHIPPETINQNRFALRKGHEIGLKLRDRRQPQVLSAHTRSSGDSLT